MTPHDIAKHEAAREARSVLAESGRTSHAAVEVVVVVERCVRSRRTFLASSSGPFGFVREQLSVTHTTVGSAFRVAGTERPNESCLRFAARVLSPVRRMFWPSPRAL